MPWDMKHENGKWCVYKKTTGKVMHCYDSKGDAEDYMSALYMHTSDKEAIINNDLVDILVTKEDDGRYFITAVSTAAVADKEDETFDVSAIDYDAKLAKESGEYPEFRMFHSPATGFGEVTDMKRVGIFAVDSGYSYNTPFAKEACEMLANNDGKWRVSRGFYVLEASGNCPQCDSSLVLGLKHMIAGYQCPTCQSTHLGFKGVLKGVHFRKAKTFDITVTDTPCVPYTGVTAIKQLMEIDMNKEQLKRRLKDAGFSEEAIEEQLGQVTEKQLKSLGDDIPQARLLKELELEEADVPEEEEGEEEEEVVTEPELPPTNGDEQTFVLDESVLEEFKTITVAAMKEVLNDFEVDIPDHTTEIELKEVPGMAELIERLKSVEEKVDKLLQDDETRLASLKEEMPRNAHARLRIVREKSKKKPEEDEEEMMEDEPMMKKVFGKKVAKETVFDNLGVEGVEIVDGHGNSAKSMTDFLLG